MTNKEKLEIIDKKLDELYKLLEQSERLIIDKDRNVRTYTTDITQSIYNLENTRLLLEPIETGLNEETEEIGYIETKEDLTYEDWKPTVYKCPTCNRRAIVYGEFIKGHCYKCNQDLVKED